MSDALPTIGQLNKTCDACPAQWEGMTSTGLYLYIRYRWGFLSCEVGTAQVYGEKIGGNLDGYMDSQQMALALDGVLDFGGFEWRSGDGC